MGRASRRWRGRRPSLRFGVVIAALGIVLVAPIGAAAASAAGDTPVNVIVTYNGKPGAAEKAAVKALGGKVKHAYTLIEGMAVTVPSKNLEKLRKSPKVAAVEHDATVTALEP